jgi:hypothetical protein
MQNSGERSLYELLALPHGPVLLFGQPLSVANPLKAVRFEGTED